MVTYLLRGYVSAGFPSPADDYVWDRLDMNELLRVDATTTFFVRAEGAMPDEGILDGDILVVDKALEARPGNLVVAIEDGDCRLRRYGRSATGAEGQVWGVVTGVTRALR